MKPEAQKGFRGRMADDLDARYEKLIDQLDAAMVATKKQWVDCPHCKKRSQVDIPNEKAMLAVAEFMANNGVGRPGPAQEADEDQIVFERVVWMTDEPEEETV